MTMSLESRASQLAITAHKDQKYGNRPYADHLAQVADKMIDILICTPSMRYYDRAIGHAAAWLHDSLEDTALRMVDIENECSIRVALLVHAVTDAPGNNRHDRKVATYPKIRENGPMAIALKLADRIANVTEGLRTQNEGLLRMYKKEHKDFGAALYNSSHGLDSIWSELDDLLKGKAE